MIEIPPNLSISKIIVISIIIVWVGMIWAAHLNEGRKKKINGF